RGHDQRSAPRTTAAGDRRSGSPDRRGGRRARRVNDRAAVDRYHDGTKHRFDRFARSLGYLDWASQPNPFRAYAVAPEVPLRFDTTEVADILRHSLGLSAWKRFRGTRWSLRVNPSSGNLHPTEAYVARSDGLFHYAPDRHALERRCAGPLTIDAGACLI